MKKIPRKSIERFKEYLTGEEKSAATVKKYVRDAEAFCEWTGNREVTKALTLEYKKMLTGKYAPTSTNSYICSVNAFLEFIGFRECRVKALKIQRKIFTSESRELTKAEYEKLISTAAEKGNERLSLVIQTICSTGIRVSELKFITAEAVCSGSAVINCKAKTRTVFLPRQLCEMLKDYIKKNGIENGPVFISKSGRPLDRSNIWTDMKKLCKAAAVPEEKVYPHNLRHLFARTFYQMQKDIVRLADILGHSSVDTTRIYTMETGDECRRQIEKMHLLRCR